MHNSYHEMKRAGVTGMHHINGSTSHEEQSSASSLRKIVSSNPDEKASLLKGRNSINEPPRGTLFGRTSIPQSVLNMVNCILGASILGYPYCFKSSGIVLATVIMVICVAACRFSYQLLLYSSQLSSKRTYEELAEQGVGRFGRNMVEACTAATNLGSIIAYLNILADVLSSVAGTLIPPGAEPSRGMYLTGVTMFAALPVALIVRDHSVVATFSTASVGFIVLFALVVLGLAAYPAAAVAAAPAAASSSSSLLMWDMEGLLIAFPVMAYSFTAHPYYLGIYNNLSSATPGRMRHVTDLSMILAAVLYWTVGAAGYVNFRGRTSGDLLRNFGGVHHKGLRGAYERAIKLCYGLSILGSIPLVIMPFYNILLPILGIYPPSSSHEHSDGMVAVAGHRSSSMKQRLSDDENEAGEAGYSPRTSKQDGGMLRHSGHTSRANSFEHNKLSGGGASSHSAGTVRASLNGSSTADRQLMPHGVGSTSKAHRHTSTDVVDIKLQHDGIHSAHAGADEEFMPSTAQHMLVVCMVLLPALAAALWLPNVEFIFGLTGATASVIISFIMPALTFIKLLDTQPHLTTGQPVTDSKATGVTVKGSVAPISETQLKWRWRRRKAMLLLIFGVVAGVACTDAIMSAVQEEAEVVQLAQQLVAQKVVVQEANRAQQKAAEAAVAVAAAATATTHLAAAHDHASNSLSKLQHAADSLAALVAKKEEGAEGTAAQKPSGMHVWDIAAVLKEHRQAVSDKNVLTDVEKALASVIVELRVTRDSVSGVMGQLDDAIANMNTNKPASPPAAGSIVEDGRSDHPAVVGLSQGRTAEAVNDLAATLARIVGDTSTPHNMTNSASMQHIRTTATTAVAALDQANDVLQQVLTAVQQAKADPKQGGSELRQIAVDAMQAALQAASTSTLAVRLTADALSASADAETQALLAIVTQVSADVQKAKKQSSTSSSSSNPSPTMTQTSPPAADSTTISTTSDGGSTQSVTDIRKDATTSSHVSPPQQSSGSTETGSAQADDDKQRKATTGDQLQHPKQTGSADVIPQQTPTDSNSDVGIGSDSGTKQVPALSGDTKTPSADNDMQGRSSTTGALKKAVEELKGIVSDDRQTDHGTVDGSQQHSKETDGNGGTSGDPVTGSSSAAKPDVETQQDQKGDAVTSQAGTSQSKADANKPSSNQEVGGSSSVGNNNNNKGSGSADSKSNADSTDIPVGDDATAVIQDVAQAAAGAQNTALKAMHDQLGKAKSKVQERVVGILQDLDENKAAAAVVGVHRIATTDTDTGTVIADSRNDNSNGMSSGSQILTNSAAAVPSSNAQSQQQSLHGIVSDSKGSSSEVDTGKTQSGSDTIDSQSDSNKDTKRLLSPETATNQAAVETLGRKFGGSQ